MPQQMDQQPACIAARPLCQLQGLLRRLNPGLHADDIADIGAELGVQANQEVNRAGLLARDSGKIAVKQRALRLDLAVDRQIALNVGVIVERVIRGAVFDEKVERVVDGHIRHDVDLDLEFTHRVGKYHPRQPVAVGVLLVVDEMPLGRDLQ